jgi:hypothetical protein
MTKYHLTFDEATPSQQSEDVNEIKKNLCHHKHVLTNKIELIIGIGQLQLRLLTLQTSIMKPIGTQNALKHHVAVGVVLALTDTIAIAKVLAVVIGVIVRGAPLTAIEFAHTWCRTRRATVASKVALLEKPAKGNR